MFYKIISSYFTGCLLAGLFLVVNSQPIQAKPTVETSLVTVAVQVNNGEFGELFQGQFDTLIAALGNADPSLLKALQKKGQRTVFAPTDTAFGALGLTPDNIDTVPVDALTNILLYHVARGRKDATEVLSANEVRMYNGEFVKVIGGQLVDNQGRVISFIVTDVPADNGIIHVIDTVLLP